jgi:hypothetical protein
MEHTASKPDVLNPKNLAENIKQVISAKVSDRAKNFTKRFGSKEEINAKAGIGNNQQLARP